MKRKRPVLVALLFVAGSLFVVAAQVAGAQSKSNFNGTWKAPVAVNGMSCTFTLVMSAGQHYSEMLQCGTMATSQSGTYVFSNGKLVRTVTDWAPKTQYVKTATGGFYQKTARPPGGTFHVTFPSADSMVWVDANLGGSLTYNRVK